MGKLIVFEGTDGSGKSTQFAKLTERLMQEGQRFERLVFPQYAEPSSALIRMYLNGEFGDQPGDVNAYAASAFYAVDRYASYMKVWGKLYEAGGLILADRYVTSNAVHQGAKLDNAQRRLFYQWLSDFEYDKLGLPVPDLVIYLDMPTALSEQLLRARERKTNTHADIHERDCNYLAACRRAALDAAGYYGWRVVSCADGDCVRSVASIHEEVYQLVKQCLEE